MKKDRYDIPVEPKAGKFGVACVFVFGVLSILAVFIAAYMWTDADIQLAAAIGVASIIVPVTVGYFISEMVHQRAGAWWFVLAAAIMVGGFGAWSVAENQAFQDRRDFIVPGTRGRSNVPDPEDAEPVIDTDASADTEADADAEAEPES